MILSWTPNEYQNFIKGSQHAQIDEYERMAKQAMFYRYAQNAKRATEKKMFDAKQARRKLDGDFDDEKAKRMTALNEAFKGFKPDFKPKGGR